MFLRVRCFYMAAEQGLWTQKDLYKNLGSRNEIFTSCDGFHQS